LRRHNRSAAEVDGVAAHLCACQELASLAGVREKAQNGCRQYVRQYDTLAAVTGG